MSLPPRRIRPDAGADQPCVRNCCLDEHDVCLGCGRTLDDIRQWSQLDAVAREQAREAARVRVEAFRRRWGQ